MITIPTPAEMAGILQFPILRPNASAQELERHCATARAHKLAAVCVNGCRVERARHCLEDSQVKVAAVVGFPLGAVSCDVKRFETEAAIDDGGQEIHTVVNLGLLRDGDTRTLLRELRDVVEAADERPVTVVIETGLLTEEETRVACECILDTGAKTVCTSTGFADAAGTIAAVGVLRGLVGERLGVTACGLFQDTDAALAAVSAGATCLCAVNAPALFEGMANRGPD